MCPCDLRGQPGRQPASECLDLVPRDLQRSRLSRSRKDRHVGLGRDDPGVHELGEELTQLIDAVATDEEARLLEAAGA